MRFHHLSSLSKSTILCFTALACVLFPAAQLMATVIPPTGLAPGSQYQLVFVTAGTRSGTSSNVADYNSFVTSEAALNPLLPSATWHAVVSTSAIDAKVNAPSSGLPVYNTAGIQVATAVAGLYTAQHLANMDFDQYGSHLDTDVWTGSIELGTGMTNAFSLGHAEGWFGLSDDNPSHLGYSTSQFRWAGYSTRATNNEQSLYALSTPITFVPEPPALVLAGLSAAGAATLARRKRQCNR